MIEEPGSFSGIGDLADSVAGTAGQPTHVVGDLHRCHRQSAQGGADGDEASCADRAAKRFVACRNSKCVSSERCCATSEPKSRCVLRPVPRPCPRSPIRPDSPRRAGPRQGGIQLRHPSGDLLAERDRRRVLEVGAPHLDQPGILLGLGIEGVAQGLDRAIEPLVQFEPDGDVHGRREGVIARLAPVDVVVPGGSGSCSPWCRRGPRSPDWR